MAEKSAQLTPMMKQYFEVKSRYPDRDTILFFRLGDFYEMFFDDAEVASKILDIALTSRNKNNDNPVPLCGIPFHSADGYIAKLLESGKKVAICEQVEDPAEARGIVKRDVIRVITPGTVTEPENIDAHCHNFLAAVCAKGVTSCVSNFDSNCETQDLTPLAWGFAVVDVTTGLFRAAEFNSLKDLNDEISRLEPSEIIISRSLVEANIFNTNERRLQGTTFTILDDPKFDPDALEKTVGEVKDVPVSARVAAGAICHYVEYTAKDVLNHIKGIEIYEPNRFMVIDESTKRNLELTKTMIDGTSYGSLLWLLDQTATPMGARLMRERLFHPLTDKAGIDERLDAVEDLTNDLIASEDISSILAKVADLERLAGRIAMETANARDLVSLKNSLRVLPQLADIKKDFGGLLKDILDCFANARNDVRADTCSDVQAASSNDGQCDVQAVADRIEAAVVEEPPLSQRDGGLIKPGFSAELDELRNVSGEGKGFIAKLEAEEKVRTGISSLKVRYNRVFGYYIEVTNTHKDKVPEDYIRKQTLANAERYITPDLKSYEEKVLGAEEKIKALEYELFSTLRFDLSRYVPEIKRLSLQIANLDCLLSLATVARKNRYTRPNVDLSSEIRIKDGRHPIIEKINTSDRFVPNDIYLNNSSERLLIITGPNMAGKSTVMRQVALIVLMAQIGSFVPAASATIGVVDRIFTRVGASDNIMRGQSTFMVEMQEAAGILKEATEKSLIIIDEIGRGTSTFDGLAIAWAVAEHIHDTIKAKTLFATHYHELVDLDLTKEGAKNFNIAVKEWNDKVIFLHKLVPGGVNHSYGIQVAQLAGLPKPVIDRAKEVLTNLETGELDEVGMPKIAHSGGEGSQKKSEAGQLQLFHQEGHTKVVKALKDADTEVMTPIEALNFVHKLKSEM